MKTQWSGCSWNTRLTRNCVCPWNQLRKLGIAWVTWYNFAQWGVTVIYKTQECCLKDQELFSAQSRNQGKPMELPKGRGTSESENPGTVLPEGLVAGTSRNWRYWLRATLQFKEFYSILFPFPKWATCYWTFFQSLCPPPLLSWDLGVVVVGWKTVLLAEKE